MSLHKENIFLNLNQCAIKYYKLKKSNDELRGANVEFPTIVMTTIFVKGIQEELTIDDLKKILLADMECKWRQVHEGDYCKLFICIKSMDNSQMKDSFRTVTCQTLERIGINIHDDNIYFIDDRNSLYLESLANYTFKRMISNHLIQNIPTFDIKVGQFVKKEFLIKLTLYKD
ncbi:Hypothetical protein NAEGRDRAFT_80907 [Naegleria gruberi]|uniref:Uncharacterized protein n=1 Tax=Naegleria gruberi TaxID=5762 RepID=D2VQX8_NAEGR|nr:uncharacterized protein NAEGRDRAFT_80907 [Naegleria gruberi]EFC40715.1 Hypothetical protein NAEGRDRAFT_80907 [Naegleria gruberi]|eukprot:XP_002673459.1 Hypothetical protein NAEGRDRAFT_80907 [Naegleria gruberi strain NEG-M]